MFPETLYPKTKQILARLSRSHILSDNDFYLAGGTGLALQLGHRKSIDLDFFTDNFPKRDILIQNLTPYLPTITQEAPGTLDILIDEVKVSFLSYQYSLVDQAVTFENTKVASILDIACMKLSAISSRGAQKDFVDLYYILNQGYSLYDLLELFEKKFTGVSYNQLHILKSLVYFDDAENDPEPEYLIKPERNWGKIKERLQEEVRTFLKQHQN